MKKVLSILLSLIVFCGVLFVLINWYPYIFSKSVDGVVYGVERVEVPMAVLTTAGARPAPQVFSFAVAVKDSKTGEIFTASSEDRRWAVVQKGQCAEVKFLPYPPWSLTRSGAFFGARLIRLYECPAGVVMPTVPATPAAPAAPVTPSAPAAPAAPTH